MGLYHADVQNRLHLLSLRLMLAHCYFTPQGTHVHVHLAYLAWCHILGNKQLLDLLHRQEHDYVPRP